jgi:hypothetical protein
LLNVLWAESDKPTASFFDPAVFFRTPHRARPLTLICLSATADLNPIWRRFFVLAAHNPGVGFSFKIVESACSNLQLCRNQEMLTPPARPVASVSDFNLNHELPRALLYSRVASILCRFVFLFKYSKNVDSSLSNEEGP